MISLTLKSIPESLVDSLREAAEVAHRSLNKEVIHRLQISFERSAVTYETPIPTGEFRVAEQAASWNRLAGKWESDLSIDEEIEALYAARTPGREVEL